RLFPAVQVGVVGDRDIGCDGQVGHDAVVDLDQDRGGIRVRCGDQQQRHVIPGYRVAGDAHGRSVYRGAAVGDVQQQVGVDGLAVDLQLVVDPPDDRPQPRGGAPAAAAAGAQPRGDVAG